jgi:hypothetical protein
MKISHTISALKLEFFRKSGNEQNRISRRDKAGQKMQLSYQYPTF